MRAFFLLIPYFLALTPVLFLWQFNQDQVSYKVVLPLLALVITGTCILHAVTGLLFKDQGKANLGAAVIIIPFFSYGHIFDQLWSWELFASMQTLNWVLGVLFFGAIIMAFHVVRCLSDPLPLNRFLLIVGFVLITLSAANIISNTYGKSKKDTLATVATITRASYGGPITPLTKDSILTPDIYYIILDGYARENILNELYAHDNSAFLDALRERGFYIAGQSNSNYPMTFLSLASTLNMRYINEDAGRIGQNSEDRTYMHKLIQDNNVGRFIKSKGYRYVSVNTNWAGTEVSDIADIELEMCPRWLRGEFVSVLMRTTAARSLCPSVVDMHLFAFDAVEKIAREPGPTFTLSHMLVPHNPYVFDAKGNEKGDIPLALQWTEKTGGWYAKKAYIEQLKYTNKRTLEMIDEILANSPVKPLIIIQSDHGSASLKGNQDQNLFIQERHAILNAFLVPDEIRSKLYPEMTSINTFPIIMNGLFDVNFPILEDKNYHSWYKKPYALREVTNIVTSKSNEP